MSESVCKPAGLQAHNDYQNPSRGVLHGKTACVGLQPQLLDRFTPFFCNDTCLTRTPYHQNHMTWNGGWPAVYVLWLQWG